MAKSKLNEALLMDLLSPHRDRLRLLCIRGVILDGAGWKSIFGELIKFPSLEEFSFGNLKENRSFVHFPSASDSLVTGKHTTFTFHRLKSLGINTGVSCRGPGARTTLQTLFESMDVGNPMGLKQTAYSA